MQLVPFQYGLLAGQETHVFDVISKWELIGQASHMYFDGFQIKGGRHVRHLLVFGFK
jgi:hypothetical protein